MSMTPTQQSALEALAGRALSQEEETSIGAMVDAWNTQGIADALSVGRTKVVPRIASARGIAELMPGGPTAAEVVLMKLEGAAATMLASADQPTKVLGSLIQRQLSFLSGEGLDFGSPALRGMLDQFEAGGILTTEEVAGLKAIAVHPDPLTHMQVAEALRGAE